MAKSNVIKQAKQTDFSLARLDSSLRDQERQIIASSQEAIALINLEQDITPKVTQFFNALHRASRAVYDGVIFKIRQSDIGLANDLLSQTGVGISFVDHDQLFYILDQHYMVKSIKSNLVSVFTNFSIEVHKGLWFAQEQETWFEGSVKMGGHDYPIFFSTKHLSRMETLLDICRAAIYTSEIANIVPPTILIAEHTKNLLRLIAWQTQCIKIQKGISQLGWNANRALFIAPGWYGRNDGIHASSATPHPKNPLFKTCYDFQQGQVGSSISASSHANSFIAVLVAALRRSYHGWNYPDFHVQHNETSEMILRAIFKVLGQKMPVNIVQLSDENHLSGYPIFTIGNAAFKAPVPAFRLQETGVSVPVQILSSEDQTNISHYTFYVLQSAIPFIINENVTGIAKTDVNFFDLCAEGKTLIDQCCKEPINVKYGKNNVLWQYLSEIPVTDLQTHIFLNLSEQKIYLNFHRIKTKRKMVKQELSLFYPEAHAEMQGNRFIKINAIEGLELLYNFYGSNIRLPQGIKAQISEEDEGSEEENSAQINI